MASPDLRVALAAVLVGASLWFAAVVLRDPQGGYEYYFWLMGAAAFGLGWLTWQGREVVIGVGLVAVPLVTAGWTAPRGDEDGLWLLVFPSLAVFVGMNAALALAAGWLHRRLSRTA